MWRSVALGACLALGAEAIPCPWANTVAGQNTFQVAAQSYKERKDASITSHSETCEVAKTQYEEARECRWSWITPWMSTVWQDVQTYCGTSSGSGGSWESSLSGSQASLPSSMSSFNSSYSGNLTTQQKLFWVFLVLLACCCCCGTVGALYLARSGKLGGKKTKPRDEFYDDEQPYGDYGDYEQQQYDQGYPGDQPPAMDPGYSEGGMDVAPVPQY